MTAASFDSAEHQIFHFARNSERLSVLSASLFVGSFTRGIINSYIKPLIYLVTSYVVFQ